MYKLIILLIIIYIVILSLINWIYKLSGYPTLLDITKELYLVYIIDKINPIKHKGIFSIIYYTYTDKMYNLTIRYKDDKITGSYPNIKSARKQFKLIIEDILISEEYERTKQI